MRPHVARASGGYTLLVREEDEEGAAPAQPHSSRVYDDFVVPEGEWTIVAVFSNNRMNFTGVTKANWEIRKNMAPGKAGRKAAFRWTISEYVWTPGRCCLNVAPSSTPLAINRAYARP
jgi:hypothetical protein